MDTEKRRINYPRRIARILLKTVLFLFLFIILVFLLVLTPPVQRFLTGKVENFLQKKLKTEVEIGSISFGLSGNVKLADVYVEDRAKDTLLSGGSIQAHINFLRLLSNEVEVKDLLVKDVTAKVKRVLPDTVFNFQFIVDAFVSPSDSTTADTSQTAPMILDISDVSLENINLTMNDVITGNDMWAHIGNLSVTIDTLDPYIQHFIIPSVIARNIQAKVKQYKPLVTPEPLAEDLVDAATPVAMKLSLGTIDLNKINIEYGNDVSAFYTTVNIGQLKTDEKELDLQNNRIYLDEVDLNNSQIAIRLGKKEAAKVVVKEVKQEVKAQKTAGWDFRIDRILLDNNRFKFDNDNNPTQAHGIDFAHMLGDSLTLHVEDFVMNTDSVGLNITEGSFKEKSGFQLDELRGDILYAYNQTYLKDLYIKTPGTEIKRGAAFRYTSYDDLVKNFSKTIMDFDIVDSRVQVKDILAFAPQLRSNPVMSDPNDIWYLNFVGNGTLDRLRLESVVFRGLRNTEVNLQGTLTGLMNPQNAGGNLTIYRLHTTQSDMALFTGQRLSTPEINLPEEFDINGTLIGNAGHINTNLNVNTSSGYVGIRGAFSNLMNPAALSYNTTIQTRGLRLGSIMRQPEMFGNLTGTFTLNGKGMTPEAINTRFTGRVASFGYNKYQYSNINMNGSLNGTAFRVNLDINDPNADLDLIASGNFSDNPSFNVSGMIDSIKTLPLHLTPERMVFRGKIDGRVSNITEDNLDADVLITKGLLVTDNERLPLDSIQLTAGSTDTANFIRLRSDIANASIVGQYRLMDLGSIIQNSIQPYFEVTPSQNLTPVQPYNFRLTADVVYTPLLTTFLPGLATMEPFHIDGRFTTAEGMNVVASTPYILFNGNEITNLDLKVNTTDKGLAVNANAGRIKSGTTIDLFNARLNATALNNNIDFNVGIDDQSSKNKYYLSGMLTQPNTGTYSLKLRPDSLLLNYEHWSVNPDNQITISPENITASNFTLSKGAESLTLNSTNSSPSSPLAVTFKDFRVATITGFINSDSLLVDGIMNGNVTLSNIMQQPAFTSDLTINDLTMKQDTIGNVHLQVSSAANNRYLTNATITGHGNDVALTGSFAPVGSDMDLDLNLKVQSLQLNSLQGAFAGMLTNTSGAINGDVRIQGKASDPDIKGDLNFDHASFSITMLGSQFRIDNESLKVTEKGLVFDNFTIRDSSDNTMNIDGTVLTSNFVNYDFNLDVTSRHFEVLNSTKAQNKLYWGKLNIDTDLHIAGTEIKPVVDGNMKVNEGTNLSIAIPQPEPGVVEREGIVQFVDMDAPENDSLFLDAYDSLNKSNILGMDIAANIEISNQATFNVIVDAINGDFLKVRGEGVLSTGIDPSGKITMLGTYMLEEGSYQIAFNFLQRRFDIQKGSSITWTGEPTTAQLDMTAVYIANTAPLDLVGSQISAPTAAIRNTYLQKLPFEVHLRLTGEMMKPVLDFDIVLPEEKNYGVSNDIVTAVQSRLDQIRQDEGEVNKQVFSLLLLGRFVGENPFQSSGGGFSAGTYARQSVSRLLTEQLNELAGGLIAGVDLNFDVASTEDYTTGERRNRTDLNVGLSKRLLNDRLKVTVGSNFMLEGPQNTNQGSSNIAGNISADYQLSRDGRYMLRFYRNNEYEGVVDGYIIEQGLSFIISVDYNRFRQIFQKKRQRVNPGTDNTTQPKTASTPTESSTSSTTTPSDSTGQNITKQ